jgi:hypothetical protein
MKKFSILLSSILILTLALVSNTALAQTPGPSDATTAPPATASAVAKVYCAGSAITLTGPQDPSTSAPFTKYHWYKMVSGTATEVTGQTGINYTETSTTAGYYDYELVTENASGCTSPVSDVIMVYVLPPLSVTITTSSASVCAGSTATPTLTANPTPATPYALNYQWTLAGVNIAGATSSTYTVPVDNTAETLNYGVTVTYALNPTCGPATATQAITINPLPTKPTITAN